jgi:hypothetical protein
MYGYNPAANPGYPQGQPFFGGTPGFRGAPTGAPPPAAFGSAAPASFGSNPAGFSASPAAFGSPQASLFGGGQRTELLMRWGWQSNG